MLEQFIEGARSPECLQISFEFVLTRSTAEGSAEFILEGGGGKGVAAYDGGAPPADTGKWDTERAESLRRWFVNVFALEKTKDADFVKLIMSLVKSAAQSKVINEKAGALKDLVDKKPTGSGLAEVRQLLDELTATFHANPAHVPAIQGYPKHR